MRGHAASFTLWEHYSLGDTPRYVLEKGLSLRLYSTLKNIKNGQSTQVGRGMDKEHIDHPPMQEIIDLISDPFMVIDRQYRIVAANKGYCQHYQIESSDIIGRHCYQVSHHASAPCDQHGEHCPMQEVFDKKRTAHVVHVHYNKDGKEERVQLTSQPLRDAYGKIAFMGEAIIPLQEYDRDQCILVGRSRRLSNLILTLDRIAPTSTTVLLEGESGVGKECVSQYIHHVGCPDDAPFIVIDCGSLSETLIESELFGYEKGAFTGATKRHPGLIEEANGGTLFIDEVSELPMPLQAKLLRLLECGTYRPIGATKYLKADTRIVVATNRPLQELTERGQFRHDLYYRLSAFPIRVPPLREHKEDIPDLAEHFLSQRADRYKHLSLSTDVLDKLESYEYPGNIRELRNILERAAILAGNGAIRTQHLHFGSDSSGIKDFTQSSKSRGKLDKLTMNDIIQILENCNGNRREAAKRLNVSERTIYRYVQRYRHTNPTQH